VAFADLPTNDDDELEESASRFLTERFPAGIPIPIPIEWLVESLPGVDFDCHPALRANHAVDGGGWAHPETAGLLVSVHEGIMDDDSRKGETHYRWTVAEQLAHLLIHRDAVAPAQSVLFKEFANHVLRFKVQSELECPDVSLILCLKDMVTLQASTGRPKSWPRRAGATDCAFRRSTQAIGKRVSFRSLSSVC
jgi:hypothetical protein